jgi:prepilin-type processing-associated H-X9-DG protein
MDCRKDTLPPSTRAGTRGFTVVELLVVIALIIVLMSFIVPQVGSMLERAARLQCKNNLRTIGTALFLYMGEHEARFPAVKRTGFRAGPYELHTILSAYLDFLPAQNTQGEYTQWIDPQHTCPLYARKNRDYGREDPSYGSYAYEHLLMGESQQGNPDDPPRPYANRSRLGGYSMSMLTGSRQGGAWQITYWRPSEIGVIWDNGWTTYPQNTTPHNYQGLPAHDPVYHALFADGHVGEHEWVHRDGALTQMPNVPPEHRN